jgi:outer membrane lipoprotein-sorting protein
MRSLRTTSTRRLLTILACAGVLVTSAAIAQAALGGSGPVPAPKALTQAIRDAINAPSQDGLTARITFTNNLLPSGSLPGTSSALTSGADGRLWLAKDGRLRLELQSDSGDAQITSDGKQITLFDSASNTVYKATLPEETAAEQAEHERKHANPTIAKIQSALDRLAKFWTVSGAEPTNVAGQPTYTVRVAPKDDGGLLGAAKLAWDSVTGAPLRAAVYAQGQESPVLELKATEVDYGAVSDDAVQTTIPAGAEVVTLGDDEAADHSGAMGKGKHSAVSGVDAVAKQLDFALAAPDKLAGLPRQGVHLVNADGDKGALVTYGEGLGAIVVFQHKVDATKPAADENEEHGGFHGGGKGSPLPEINIDGTTGTELATALGTVVSFERDGVKYLVAGSVPPVAAENAARGLK